MERKIAVYGHGDKRPVFGFPTDEDFQQWIKEDIFSKYQCRYHYTLGMEADVIVLSRGGLAFGHFEIDSKVKPNQKDYEDYPDLKFVYIVRSSALYGNPVRLSGLGIKDIQFGKYITDEQFGEIKKAADAIQQYRE